MSKKTGHNPTGEGAQAKVAGASAIVRPSVSRLPTNITDESKARFLKALEACGNWSGASMRTFGANISQRLKRIAEQDPAFRRACEAAIESYGARVLDVLNEEIFVGTKTLVTTKDGPVRDEETGEYLYNYRRDARVILAAARKFDRELRESKTVDVTNTIVNGAADQERFSIYASELSLLTESELSVLRNVLIKVSARRESQRFDEEAATLLLKPLPSNTVDAEFEVVEETIADTVETIDRDPWE